MKYPICGDAVTKVIESNHEYKNSIECENEFYYHRDGKLIKVKAPKSPFDNLIDE